MSECPGTMLEDFLGWKYSMEESIDSPLFAKIVEIHEPIRSTVETMLDGFNDECQSWRSFGSTIDEYIPGYMDKEATFYINNGVKTSVDNPDTRISMKGNVLVNDKHNFIEIDDKAPWGLKCILINRQAGVGYVGVLNRRDNFPTHYCPMPTFVD